MNKVSREIFTYVVVGVGITVVYLLLGLIFENITGNVVMSSALAYLISTTLSYFSHHQLTFKADVSHVSGGGRYVIVALLCLVISMLIPKVLSNLLSLPAIFSFLAVAVVVPVVNFLAMKFYVFRISN